MAEYILDGIEDVPAFFEALFEKHRFYRSFIPEFARTAELAARYMLVDEAGLSLRSHNGLSIYGDSITLRLDSSLDRADMIKLMSMVLIVKGERYGFYGLEVEASHGYHDIGDRCETTSSWIEVNFKELGWMAAKEAEEAAAE